MSVSDNGSAFTSNAILTWADSSKVRWHYIAPGKPMQNPSIERYDAWRADLEPAAEVA